MIQDANRNNIAYFKAPLDRARKPKRSSTPNIPTSVKCSSKKNGESQAKSGLLHSRPDYLQLKEFLAGQFPINTEKIDHTNGIDSIDDDYGGSGMQ